MNIYNETFETWDKVAALYQDKFMLLDLYNETYDCFCNLLSKQSSSILEIGCGPGNITKYLLSKRQNLHVFGIDVAPSMIALAAKNNPTANFEVMDCRNIQMINKKFDGIICGFCLPYLSEQDSFKLIEDCKNLLIENGILYLSFVEGEIDKSGFKTGSSGHRTYFYYHNLQKLTQTLLVHGFDEHQIFRVNYEKGDGAIEVHTIILSKKILK